MAKEYDAHSNCSLMKIEGKQWNEQIRSTAFSKEVGRGPAWDLFLLQGLLVS
jgi:hypothetical protein